nr:copper resistance protein CopC [uncultured Microbacterium sp.]
MKTVARRLPALSLALAIALLAAFLVMFSPLSASAHDSLTSSSPEADGTVETLPAELTLTFSADLITGDGATEVVVTDPSGQSVTSGAAVTSGATVTQPLAAQAPAGLYHVIWKVVSSDGHPTSGEYDFTVSSSSVVEPTEQPTAQPTSEAGPETPSATPAPSDTADATPAPAESTPASSWIWILVVAGILVVVGGIAVAVTLRRAGGPTTPRGDDSDAPSER